MILGYRQRQISTVSRRGDILLFMSHKLLAIFSEDLSLRITLGQKHHYHAGSFPRPLTLYSNNVLIIAASPRGYRITLVEHCLTTKL